jgi:hypothetical protein
VNDRAVSLGELLSCKAAPVSEEQLAEHWGISSPTGRRHLAAWLSGLVRNGLLRRYRVLAKPAPPLDAPLLIARPGDPIGDMAALAWRLEKRWSVEPRVTTVYVRGPRCRQLFGGAAGPDISNLASVSHDLALTALYLRFCRRCPARARDWVPDWERKGALEYGEKLPDVLLHGADGKPYLAIEMAGIYRPSRLIGLLLFSAETLQLPLEVF